MAGGGFSFLLLTFQYLVGWGIFNLFISMNSFRLVSFDNYQRRSPFRLLGGRESRPDITYRDGLSADPLGRWHSLT